MSNQIFLSIVTVPDIGALRLINQFGDLSDDGVLSASMHLHHQKHGNKILPLYQQQIVSIAAIQRTDLGELTFTVLGKSAESEAQLLNELTELMNKAKRITSWDMNDFDLPLINYRLLKHGIANPSFYSAEKLSLSDCLSNLDQDNVEQRYAKQANTAADLVGLSRSLEFPEIDELSDQEITASYMNGDPQNVHAANQSRALSCYLIYLRYQLITAAISADEYEAAYTVLSTKH